MPARYIFPYQHVWVAQYYLRIGLFSFTLECVFYGEHACPLTL